MRLRALLSGLLATVIPLLAVASAATAHSQHDPTPIRKEVKMTAPHVVGDMPDPYAAAGAAIDDYLQVDNYLKIQHYYALMEEARVRAEEAARAAAARKVPPPRVSTGGGVGDCTGFAIPDYIIQRESGGQPFVKNPNSSAFGCAQTLLEHYNAGHTCAGDDPYTIDGQRSCVDKLSNGGTNLEPWRLTR